MLDFYAFGQTLGLSADAEKAKSGALRARFLRDRIIVQTFIAQKMTALFPCSADSEPESSGWSLEHFFREATSTPEKLEITQDLQLVAGSIFRWENLIKTFRQFEDRLYKARSPSPESLTCHKAVVEGLLQTGR